MRVTFTEDVTWGKSYDGWGYTIPEGTQATLNSSHGDICYVSNFSPEIKKNNGEKLNKVAVSSSSVQVQ